MFGHSLAVLAAMGHCAADPRCAAPASIRDDDNPEVRYCAAHARERLTDEG